MNAVHVDPADLRIVLDQQSGHAHRRPGIWDPDNRPDRANKRCVECAARERLRQALDSQAATPASAGESKATSKDLQSGAATETLASCANDLSGTAALDRASDCGPDRSTVEPVTEEPTDARP